MTNLYTACEEKGAAKRFLLDEATGHVLTASLNRAALTSSLKSEKYDGDPDACGARISDLSERAQKFLVRAELIAKVDQIDIYQIKDYAFAVYHCGDRWDTTFLNCVLITDSVNIRRSAAKHLDMRLVIGLTEWLFSMHTGLIDANPNDTLAPLLNLPVIRRLSPSSV